jgi:predicted nucleic acid-binding protein
MRNVVVVDASIAIKWIFEEPDTDTAEMLLDEWSSEGKVMLAPALLVYEITNALYRKIRKGEVTLESAKESLADLFLLGFEFTYPQQPDLSLQAMDLAYRFNLSATYDSHYLALAELEGCELWTADIRLWNSSKGKLNWVRWMGNYSAPSDKQLGKEML